MNIKALLLIIATLILTNSCSKQSRCNYHTSRAIKLNCLSVTNDTVFYTDTVKGWQFDTVFHSDTLKDIDTFVSKQDDIIIKKIVNWKTRIIKETVKKKDTVKTYYTITQKRTVIKYPAWQKYCVYFVVVLLLIWVVKQFKN